jgi:hypothetical protein
MLVNSGVAAGQVIMHVQTFYTLPFLSHVLKLVEQCYFSVCSLMYCDLLADTLPYHSEVQRRWIVEV